jgi:hypothetical protein
MVTMVMPPMKNEAKILARFNPTLVTLFEFWMESRPGRLLPRDSRDACIYRNGRFVQGVAIENFVKEELNGKMIKVCRD